MKVVALGINSKFRSCLVWLGAILAASVLVQLTYLNPVTDRGLRIIFNQHKSEFESIKNAMLKEPRLVDVDKFCLTYVDNNGRRAMVDVNRSAAAGVSPEQLRLYMDGLKACHIRHISSDPRDARVVFFMTEGFPFYVGSKHLAYYSRGLPSRYELVADTGWWPMNVERHLASKVGGDWFILRDFTPSNSD